MDMSQDENFGSSQRDEEELKAIQRRAT